MNDYVYPERCPANLSAGPLYIDGRMLNTHLSTSSAVAPGIHPAL